MNEPVSKQKAALVTPGGACWEDVPIERVVTDLQAYIFQELATVSPGSFPNGLPLVYLPGHATGPVHVTLSLGGPLSLVVLLDALADAAALSVFYAETGIVIVPIPTVDHENSEAFDAEEAAGLTIPGLTSTTDEQQAALPPPPLPEEPLPEPVQTNLSHVLTRYPFFAEMGNDHGLKFFRLLDVFQGVPVDFLALADLVAIYAPPAPSAE